MIWNLSRLGANKSFQLDFDQKPKMNKMILIERSTNQHLKRNKKKLKKREILK